jgi:Zn finger protein HypA/HybF involved in hydrogenase expression
MQVSIFAGLSLIVVAVGFLAHNKNRKILRWCLIWIACFVIMIALDFTTGPAILILILIPIILILLPFLCPKCKAPLSNTQRKEKKCPKCDNQATVLSIHQLQDDLIIDDSIPRVDLVINKERNIPCPNCNRPLHLDDNDIKSKYFKCPSCKSETYFKPIFK